MNRNPGKPKLEDREQEAALARIERKLMQPCTCESRFVECNCEALAAQRWYRKHLVRAMAMTLVVCVVIVVLRRVLG